MPEILFFGVFFTIFGAAEGALSLIRCFFVKCPCSTSGMGKKNKLGVCWREKAVVPFRISSLTLGKKSGKRERHDLNHWASWHYSENQGSCGILTLPHKKE